MANESEREQWSGAVGRPWVERQADLDALMAGIAEALVARAALAPGMRVLDIGCGTGATAIAAARAVAPGGRVVGVDIAPPLLAVARRRSRDVAWVEADAQSDPLPGGPFDRAISRFGVMFFGDPVAAFRNVAGHLAPGGRLAAVAWGPAEANPWFHVPARVAAARLGPLPPLDPTAPGPLAFADAGRVGRILSDAGLRDVGAEAIELDLVHPDLGALASLATWMGPAARQLRIKEATAREREAMREALAEAFAPFAEGAGARVPARLILYTGAA
mgnify:CR=1 FL=1